MTNLHISLTNNFINDDKITTNLYKESRYIESQHDMNTQDIESLVTLPVVTLNSYYDDNQSTSLYKSRSYKLHWNKIRHWYPWIRNTIALMTLFPRILFWSSVLAMAASVVWYSRELYYHGTDPHLIAWFSAGGFVILGFPISIYGILMHLSNYYQPNIQCYVVRILWMVPLYSIESWLCLRFHIYAIYIETLRDCYESFVLYCFLQFLIQVLGGEESIILVLKDKSPTFGVHYSPLPWILKPWTMGQPLCTHSNKTITTTWTSPFFVKCKLGVLQYVLLKFILSLLVMILEKYNLYQDGDFTPTRGYLYICIITNMSQCWALYCLILFYYALQSELSPIRPVGKFLSVKALIFFTWWQSVGISLLFQIGWISEYQDGQEWTAEDVAKGIQDYLICVEMFLGAIIHTFVFPHTDYLKPFIKLTFLSNVQGTCSKRFGRIYPSWKTRGLQYYDVPMEDKSHASPISKTENSISTMETPSILTSLPHIIQSVYPNPSPIKTPTIPSQPRTGFVRALIDSTVPKDVMSHTVGIARGDFHVKKKSLLSHAVASDDYKLFTKRRRRNPLNTEKKVYTK